MRSSFAPGLLGASLLAASASVPLHLMPLLVVAVAAQGRLPLAEAGWVGSAYMVGQLATTIGLPALKARRLGRSAAALAAAALLVALMVSSGQAAAGLLGCWLAVGAACGALQFIGATTAAAASDRQRAFAQRLGVTLLVSGAVIVAVQAQRGFASYSVLAAQLVGMASVLLALGVALYRTPGAPQEVCGTGPGSAAPARPHLPLGLVVLFLLFVGQPGFWAYAVQGAQQRGIVFEHLAYSIALCKAVAGVVLLVQARQRGGDEPAGRPGLWLPGLAVALGVAGMALGGHAAAFTAGLLVWELGLNVLSARLQAAVVQDSPAVAGPWLAATVFLGAAAGPALHGLAIGAGAPMAFAVYAALCALLPAAWLAFSRCGAGAGPRPG